MNKPTNHKALLILISFLLILQSCSQKAEEHNSSEEKAQEEEIYLFTTFKEPKNEGLYLAFSFDGYHWEDLGGVFLPAEVGQSKIMRDPSVTKGPDGTYHMVWTTDWKGGNGFGYARTKDFINWSPQQFIPAMEFEPSVVNVWAPEIYYDDEDDQFIVIWASTIPHRFERGEEEEDNNHRMYYLTTKDFKEFSETKLFIDPGFSIIDAVIVKRAPQDYVLVLKDNTRPMRNLKVAFGKSPIGPYENISEPYTSFLTEGPTVVNKDGEWIIYYDSYGDKSYSAVVTSDFREFVNIGEKLSFPEGHKHGTITTISKEILENLKEISKNKSNANDTE
ncbi:glycoside hydrolase family 43 protein [Belliella sp. DSM 111904]|uniref:Glycoside hydrolase family 43 protein n=1 Tax=Belliella filtrata TaxID=2923435 RepID=A0ABS9UV77_9BACT|nr:glycoside hydrolase family 43 protein [Belliella filtrata]MCH7408080.1 glycoside hydrolase family 43 protein [Belliella filtrata]